MRNRSPLLMISATLFASVASATTPTSNDPNFALSLLKSGLSGPSNGAVFRPATGDLVVSQFGANQVSLVNATSGATSLFASQTAPDEVAVRLSDGLVAVKTHPDGPIDFFDSTGTFQGSIPAGIPDGCITGLAFDASGNLFVAAGPPTPVLGGCLPIGWAVYEFSGSTPWTASPATVVSGLNGLEGLAFSGTHLLAISFTAGNLYQISGSTATTIASVPSASLTQPTGVAVDPLTGDVYVSEFLCASTAIPCPTGSDVLKLPAGGTTFTVFATGFTKPIGLGFDTAGSLYVNDFGTGDLWKFIRGVTATLTFPVGTSTQVANFNPTDPVNHHSWKATVNAATPFTFTLSAFETTCGNSCPSGIDNDPSDFQCRFHEYFSGDSQLPKPVPYVENGTMCAFYRVDNPPPDADIASDILFTIGYNEPGGSGTSFCGSMGAATRIIRDPSEPPPDDAALNHSFAVDFTDFFNPAGMPGDPTISGDNSKTFSDYVVACRFPIGSAVFLRPKAGAIFNTGSAVPFMVRVKNSTTGAFITDAATAPNSMPLSIFFNGALIPTFGNPGGSPGFWTYNAVDNVYMANAKTPKGAAPGNYTACIDSFRDPTAIPSPPPYFVHTCVTFALK